MKCYKCDKQATTQCSECKKTYCNEHGTEFREKTMCQDCIDTDLAKWKHLYLDTFALSYLAHHTDHWRKLQNYLFAERLFLAISGTHLLELVEVERQHETLKSLFLLMPSDFTKPIEQIINEEVIAYPNPRTDPPTLQGIQVMLLEEGDPFERLRSACFRRSPRPHG